MENPDTTTEAVRTGIDEITATKTRRLTATLEAVRTMAAGAVVAQGNEELQHNALQDIVATVDKALKREREQHVTQS